MADSCIRSCCVCLKEPRHSIGCNKCSADYCKDCLFSSKYTLQDENYNKLCCICKGIVATYSP